MLGCAGSVLTGPCQVPARVFSRSKDFCASDFGADGSADAGTHMGMKTRLMHAGRVEHNHLILLYFTMSCSFRTLAVVLLYITITLRFDRQAISDGRIAALAILRGVDELLSADRDFSRFPELALRNPL